TRFIVIEQAFTVSKICMAIDLCLWYVRILHLFAAYERLGTKLLMIYNTVTWYPSANGGPSRYYTLANDGTGLWNWNLLRNVFDWGIWKIFGQVNLIALQEADNSTLTGANKYGTLTIDENNKLNANMHDLVVFNALDKIHISGNVTSIIVHFCTLPTIVESKISLYAMSPTNDPNKFSVTATTDVLLDRIKPSSSNTVQTIPLTSNLSVATGQYIAIRFEVGSGSPYSIAERNEYFVNSKTFDDNLKNDLPIPFTNCSNKGIAFGFTINSTSPGHYRRSKVGITEGDIEMQQQQPQPPLLFSPPKQHKKRLPQSKIIRDEQPSGANKFQEYDNMLRENAIAEDYWKPIIDRIKENERINDEDEEDYDKHYGEKIIQLMKEKDFIKANSRRNSRATDNMLAPNSTTTTNDLL
ncbi:unnamed protein product, partial [Didymodactylos carnosus]